jgi:protein-disulfide isomerase/uncharacterized membrane protein
MGGMDSKESRKWGVITLLALAGILVSIYLTRHFYDVRTGTAGFQSSCNISSSMNCDAVAASSWSELAFGLPLSGFAAGWYLAILILSLMARLEDWRRGLERVMLAMCGTAFALSVFYLAVMAIRIRTYCLYCLLTDIINAGLLGCALLLPRRDGRTPDWKAVIGVTIVSLGITLLLLTPAGQGRPRTSDVAELVRSTLESPALPVDASPEYPTLGATDAPVTIVEFSDFQCPFCRLGAVLMNTLLNRYPGQVKVVFRNLPLSPECNAKMTHPMHPVACEAARTALCAHRDGKFKAVYEAIFENQESLAPGKPAEYARAAGIDPDRLKACAESLGISEAIRKDVAEADRLEIQSTPTFFINGHRVDGAMPLQVWSGLIEKLAPAPR